MIEFIKFEVIRNLRRKDVRLLFIILIMCELVLMTSLHQQSFNEPVYSDSAYWVANDAHFRAEPPEELEKMAMEDIAELNEGLLLYFQYENEKDWDKMYFEAMKFNNYFSQVCAYDPNEVLDEVSAIWLQNADIVYKIREKYDFISIDEYASIIDTNTNFHHDFPWHLHELQYFTSLYEQHLEPMTYSHIDSTTAFIQIVRHLLAVVTPILAALLFFNDRREYHEMGVDKTMMIIPSVRKKFVLGKIVANSIIMMLVVFGPILIFTLLLGLFDQFRNINYPLLANPKGLTEIYFPYFDKVYGPSTLQEAITRDSLIYFGVTLTSPNMLMNPYMDFMPLWKIVFFGVILFIPLIVLYVQINMLLTRLIKNAYIALITNIAVILILIMISPLPSMNLFNVINPLTYRDPIVNVMGTSYFPWLAGMLVMIFYNIVLFICNKIVFSHQYYD